MMNETEPDYLGDAPTAPAIHVPGITPESYQAIRAGATPPANPTPRPYPAFGEMDLEQFNDEVYDILDSINELLTSKRKSYGPGNLTRHGEAGIIVRMGDKMQRLDNFAEKIMRGEVNDVFADGESVEDAYRDMIGYAVLALLWRRCRERQAARPE